MAQMLSDDETDNHTGMDTSHQQRNIQKKWIEWNGKQLFEVIV